MVDSAASTDPLSWRIASYQTALLLLVVCGCAALNIYGHPSGPITDVTIAIGLVALAVALVGVRMYFVVLDDGVAIRYLGSESWLPWSQIDRIEIVSGVRGSDTIRFTRPDGTYVDVPPSLLQPSAPTNKMSARARLKNILSQIEERRS